MKSDKHADELVQIICQDGGHIYVCGDVLMAEQVGRAVQVTGLSFTFFLVKKTVF